MKKNTIPKIIAAVCSVPVFAHAAGGGGPLLLLIDFYLFSVGQIWMVFVEFLYLVRLWPGRSRGEIFVWTLMSNLVSTLLAAFLIPFLWASFFAMLAAIPGVSGHETGRILMAAGTWIGEDGSFYSGLAMGASLLLFVLIYFVTVKVEYRLLRHYSEKITDMQDIRLRDVYVMNLFSYAGLIFLFVAGNAWK
jgi:hypothetical protein